MTIKCFFFGHHWKVKWQTESKDLCECDRDGCGAKAHFKSEKSIWDKKHRKLVKS